MESVRLDVRDRVGKIGVSSIAGSVVDGCVPSGPYVPKAQCPCYRDLKNPNGKDKCPWFCFSFIKRNKTTITYYWLSPLLLYCNASCSYVEIFNPLNMNLLIEYLRRFFSILPINIIIVSIWMRKLGWIKQMVMIELIINM